METSPPVRDVSERNRANRNKCIVVAVTSILIVAAVIIVISYITHFGSTELSLDSASALIDKAVAQSKNDSIIICDSFEIILKENETSLIEKVGCVESSPAREDIDRRNETNDEPIPRPNITCKLSLSNIKITALSNSSKQFKECHVNAALEVEFVFNTDNKVQNITIRPTDPDSAVTIPARRAGKDKDLVSYLQSLVEKVLADEILQLAAEYSTGDTTVLEETNPVNVRTVCSDAPWQCS